RSTPYQFGFADWLCFIITQSQKRGEIMAEIKFQMIADSRWCEDIGNEIERLDRRTRKAIEKLTTFYHASAPRLLDFPDDGVQQYRIDYIIPKTKNFTYKQLYAVVNSVKPVHYQIIR